MKCLAWFLSLAILPLGAVLLRADEPGEKTLLTERGKLMLQTDLNQPLKNQWRVAKGEWKVVDGVLSGRELKSDNHGAVARYPVSGKSIVIQYAFQLNGAKMTTLSINKEKGHLCRVKISPKQLTVQKDDQDGKRGPDKAKVLMSRPVKLAPGEWHTLVLELCGTEMLASLDGEVIVFGSHPALDQPIANFGFTVAGESVLFKDLRVWNAQPNQSWPTTRKQLSVTTGNK